MWFFLEKLESVFSWNTLFPEHDFCVFSSRWWMDISWYFTIFLRWWKHPHLHRWYVRRPKWGPAIPPGSPRDPVTARQSYWILRVFWVLTVDRNSGPFVGDFLECGKTRKRLLECWLKPQQFTQNPDKNNEIVVGQSIGIPYLIQQWHLIIAV